MGLSHKMSYRFLVNILSLMIMLCLTVLLRLNALPTFNRGFFCNDVSIRYPYKPETFPTKYLIATSVIIPIVIIFSVEFLSSSKKCNWKSTLINTGQIATVFLFGGVSTVVITDVGKSLAGWPRPHFLAVCKPNVTCIDGDEYYEDYICTGEDRKLITKSRHSFPSGHASVAAYVAFFLAAYFRIRLRSNVFRPILQLILLTFAWASGLSRVSDYMHHMMDVIVGFALGTVVGYVIFKGAEPFLHRKNDADYNDTVDDDDVVEISCLNNRIITTKNQRVVTASNPGGGGGIGKPWNENELPRPIETRT